MSTKPTTPPVVPETPEPSAAATPVANKRIAATGAIPKHVQSWIFLGIIAVAAVGLWFTGIGHKSRNTNGAAAAEQVKPLVGGLSPEEVQKRLQESEDSRRTAAANSRPRPPAQPTDARLITDTGVVNPNPSAPAAPAPTVDPIAEDERKREYAGRYASNVALSYRADPHAGAPALRANASVSSSKLGSDDLAAASQTPGLPAAVQQQFEMLQAQQETLRAQQRQPTTTLAQPAVPSPQQTQAVPARTLKNADLNAATGKNHVIFEGTVLESVLVNRLNGDFAGPVICQTTNDIYSHDHNELLIPAGTRLLGETKKVSDVGQERLAVVFHRLIMPDGYAVDLDQAPGLNQIGETALHDKVNNHYFKIFGASIAVGAIAGLASIGASNSSVTGLPTSNLSAYREGVTASLSQSSLHILDRFLNIPPTITIREGHRVRIFLTQDLLVPAYAQHKMPSDL
jgi:type IV secretory pathway VirB10-like protein